jgi:hypothetical protein
VSLALRNGKHVVLLGATPQAIAFFEQVANRAGIAHLLSHADSADETIAHVNRVLSGRTA